MKSIQEMTKEIAACVAEEPAECYQSMQDLIRVLWQCVVYDEETGTYSLRVTTDEE